MAKEYVDLRDGGYYIAGSRVSLESIVYAYLRGEEADEIAASFPAVTLEEIFGAIAFYLANRPSIDEYLQRQKAEFARLRDEARRESPSLYARLDAARRNTPKPAA
jgi:uncharacterized protein (DUF433 family)